MDVVEYCCLDYGNKIDVFYVYGHVKVYEEICG
jgi:hypothetical protein